jgi:hypothetical protein
LLPDEFKKQRNNKFQCQITIPELPKTINAIGRKHWAIKVKEARRWKNLVHLALGSQKPEKPLRRAVIACRRYSAKCPDYDGLVSSFKHVIDGLVTSGVIEDDSFKHIGMPYFSWLYAPKKKGFIVVEVLEIS